MKNVVQQFVLTLATVAAGVAVWTGAGVLSTAAAIHTPDVTGLNCRGPRERERERKTSVIDMCQNRSDFL